MTVSWSPQQDAALRKVQQWLLGSTSNQQVFRLFGFAGCGKTTMAIEIANGFGQHTVFAAYTGKAALVMNRKGCLGASTIHRLIYKVRDDAFGGVEYLLNEESPLKDADLCIIDECSMVDEELAKDLMSFGKPILVLGDPAQLPPVRGAGYFIHAEPDIMLTEIHRQAADNPIIRMATNVRQGGRLQIGDYDGPNEYGQSRVIRRDQLSRRMVMGAGQVLVGLNRTKREVNQKMRTNLERADWRPEAGDRLVCLRNRSDRGLLNGSLWIVSEVLAEPRKLPGERKRNAKEGIIYLSVTDADEPGWSVDVEVIDHFFNGNDKVIEGLPLKLRRAYDEFDYGYALTCHKAQGSQWNDVLIFDEGWVFKEFRHRWLYTALTRAAERVVVVTS